MHEPDERTLPTIDEVLASPCTSFWLKDAIKASLQRDPVDAALDAELLAYLLTARADQLLNR